MTPREAKLIVADWLRANDLPAYPLAARTVDFSDLARTAVVFVTVRGPVHEHKPGSLSLPAVAREYGFRVTTGDR